MTNAVVGSATRNAFQYGLPFGTSAGSCPLPPWPYRSSSRRDHRRRHPRPSTGSLQREPDEVHAGEPHRARHADRASCTRWCCRWRHRPRSHRARHPSTMRDATARTRAWQPGAASTSMWVTRSRPVSCARRRPLDHLSLGGWTIAVLGEQRAHRRPSPGQRDQHVAHQLNDSPSAGERRLTRRRAPARASRPSPRRRSTRGRAPAPTSATVPPVCSHSTAGRAPCQRTA